MAKQEISAAWSAVARAPMLRLAVPFVAGLSVALWHTPELRIAVVMLGMVSAATLLILVLPAGRDVRWQRGPIVGLWCFVFGLFWQTIRDPMSHPLHASRDGSVEQVWAVRLTAINGITEKVVRADADVLGVHQAGSLDPRIAKAMVTLMRNGAGTDPVAGDELVIRTRLEPITRIPDPGGFDRRSWAASRGMYHECFAGLGQWSVVGHGWRWTDLFEGTRQRVSRWLEQSGLPFRERALVKALVLGLRDELDSDQKDAFVRSGTIHVLAVSGTHVGFIYAILLFMLGWWGGGRQARIGRGVLVLLALWCYAGLTGACPSVLRATIMFSLFTVAGMSARRADPLNSLFTAAFLLLVWDPHMLIEIGFQLSFLAVMGIILFHGPLVRSWVPNNRWVSHIWTLSVMSVAAQLLTTPLSLFLFQAFPVWFLPANLVVVTAAGFAVYGAVALLALYRVPLLGPLLASLLTMLLMIVDRVTSFFAGLPGAYPAIRVGAVDMLLLYVLVMAVAAWLMWRWRPAARLALAAVALLLVGWVMHIRGAHERVTFTVYDDRKALQAAMTVGRSHVVLSDDDVSNDDAWMRKKLDRHQRSMGLNVAEMVATTSLSAQAIQRYGDTFLGADRWCADGVDVRFASGSELKEAPKDKDECDVLVLHDIRYLGAEELERSSIRAKQVVLIGNMGWGARSIAKRWFAEHGVPVHDVRDQGAFVLTVQGEG